MDDSKNGGKDGLASDTNVSRPQKLVTSSTLKRANESAIESKRHMLAISAQTEQFVVTIGANITGKTRNLTSDEIQRLRATKQAIASRLSDKFCVIKKR
jgi:hypothetical protein